ncbi:hypothetical protein K461DRAFT_274591 [Myriangium duriaei CBS 260.36]|uniref:Uncharacterized protein n=1 Tax=Myriangium duriaei CBS 260.36 TaxID=1168546 RepID=A0A9P4J671_9PEZI|nr:hypothetical protein K461DRAFT_274591 [Myriangium duriaei CBS 260.36]
MSAPRLTQFLPLRRLATPAIRQRRNLHMTGPATYASPALHPPPPSSTTTSASLPARPFHVSRHPHAAVDNSRIDVAILPSSEERLADFAPPSETVAFLRVPIIPSTVTTTATAAAGQVEAPDAPVMKPEILAADPESVSVSPMADVHDNGAVHIDFLKVADSLGGVVERVEERVDEYVGLQGTIGRVWAGFVEDITGKQGKVA